MNRTLKSTSYLVGAVVFGWTSLVPLPAVTLDRIVGVVDKYIILQSDIDELHVQLSQQGQMEDIPEDKAKLEILNRLLDDKVMLVIAERDTTIKLDPSEVDNQVESQIKQLALENGGEERLGKILEQSTGFTLPEFRKKRKELMREQMLKQRFQQKTVGQNEPSSKQVREFFETYKDSLPTLKNNYKISHLQISVKPSKEIETRAYKLADSLIKALDKGAKFEELAKNFSDDPTGEEGGDLGFTKRGALDGAYERVAFSLGVNEYSKQPVRSKIGYHIIKVTGKKDLEIKTSHILKLVVPTAEDTLATFKLLDSIQAKVSTKEDFAKAVAKYSDEKKSLETGGSLGWFTNTNMKPEYLQAVDSLAVGSVSAPILIDDHYHLFFLEEKKDERSLTLEDDWNQLFQLAKNYATNQKMQKLLVRWRQDVHVENRW